MNLTESARRKVSLLMPTSAWCAGIGQHRLMCTSNKLNLLVSDPEVGGIWCAPFKKPSGQELAEGKREISRRFPSVRAIFRFSIR